jgi:hypothetical protein
MKPVEVENRREIEDPLFVTEASINDVGVFFQMWRFSRWEPPLV